MKPGLGTQLRHLLDLLDGAVERAYVVAGLRYRPRYTPVMRALIAKEPCLIGEIADAARITQPAATQTVALMLKEGLLIAEPGPVDGRQRLIRLSPRGRALLPKLRVCWQATQMAADHLDASLPRPLSQVLDEAIGALAADPFQRRIENARTQLLAKTQPVETKQRNGRTGGDAAKRKRTTHT
jgi:DNA-binding MarR family transcriptional regulator